MIISIFVYMAYIIPLALLFYFLFYRPRLEKWLKLNGTCIKAKIVKIENAYGKDILEIYAHEKDGKNFDIRKFCTKTMQDRQSDVSGYCAEVFCEYNGIVFKELFLLREILAPILERNIKYLTVYYNQNFPKQYTIMLEDLDSGEDFGSIGEDA